MDIWKYYDITHRKHLVCNPTSENKLVRLIRLLNLPGRAKVVDIACGKGEFLIRLAEQYDVTGVGVDMSPYCIAGCQKKAADRAPRSDIEFLEMDGAEFKPEGATRFDLAACIGASWIFKGHSGTLRTLQSWVAPGGWVVVGEPFWLQDPSQEYLEASGVKKEDFGTHAENVELGERHGLGLVHTIVSERDDWDQYEGLQWLGVDEYVRNNSSDPDITELTSKVSNYKNTYLRWGRDTLGWAIYVFRYDG
jgi:cyclopropane fatty-acyl-phospholipid synthase-like methyltransferase